MCVLEGVPCLVVDDDDAHDDAFTHNTQHTSTVRTTRRHLVITPLRCLVVLLHAVLLAKPPHCMCIIHPRCNRYLCALAPPTAAAASSIACLATLHCRVSTLQCCKTCVVCVLQVHWERCRVCTHSAQQQQCHAPWWLLHCVWAACVCGAKFLRLKIHLCFSCGAAHNT